MADQFLHESELAALAKKLRMAAGKTRSEAAQELAVTPPSLYHAEESPQKSLTKLRCRIIELYSGKKVTGPYFCLEQSKR